jgi:alpha-L-fucosidase 2
MPVGYLPTCHWAAHAAFVAQLFWWHYLYSQDETFLREVAHPFLIECARFYLDFLKKDANGVYQIELSSNPEAGEGSYEAWGRNPAVDIAFLHMLFDAVEKSSRILNRDQDIAEQCHDRRTHLAPFPIRDGRLIEMESKEFFYSQRHTGILSAIYPCDFLIDRKTAAASYQDYIDKGEELWGGHSMPWVACVAARLERGEEARDWLRSWMQSYTIPQGGFNLSYNYHRTGQIAGPPIFCNETNSGYCAGLLEMLLQSYDGIIRVFPAVPADWKEISFKNLRAQGACLISAIRRKGKILEVAITSEKGGEISIKNPWNGRIQRLSLKKGQTIRLTSKTKITSNERTLVNQKSNSAVSERTSSTQSEIL